MGKSCDLGGHILADFILVVVLISDFWRHPADSTI